MQDVCDPTKDAGDEERWLWEPDDGIIGQVEMGVGIAAACVVDGKVGAYSRVGKLLFHILADRGNAIPPFRLPSASVRHTLSMKNAPAGFGRNEVDDLKFFDG